MHKLLYACAALVLAPLAGGLVLGLDRKIAGRLRSRAAPPLLQPFHHAFRLAGKAATAEPGQTFTAWMRLLCSAVAVFLLSLGSDLLAAFFVYAAGAAFSAMAGVSSPFVQDRIRARAELAAQLACGPLLALALVAMALATGSFKGSSAFGLARPLLYKLPLIFHVLVGVLAVKLGKPPFDSSPSGPGDQSGRTLALAELANWYDTAFLFGVCALFWTSSPLGMAALLAGVFVFLAALEAAGARLDWKSALGYALGWGLALSILNLMWLYGA